MFQIFSAFLVVPVFDPQLQKLFANLICNDSWFYFPKEFHIPKYLDCDLSSSSVLWSAWEGTVVDLNNILRSVGQENDLNN